MCTIVMVIIMLTYCVLEFITIYTHDGSLISTHTVLNYFDSDYEFNSDKLSHGFEIAFGWTSYDNNYEMVKEPEYGELQVIRKSWSGEDGMAYEEVPYRPCTDVELGLGPNGFDDPQSRFYQMSENEKVWY